MKRSNTENNTTTLIKQEKPSDESATCIVQQNPSKKIKTESSVESFVVTSSTSKTPLSSSSSHVTSVIAKNENTHQQEQEIPTNTSTLPTILTIPASASTSSSLIISSTLVPPTSTTNNNNNNNHNNNNNRIRIAYNPSDIEIELLWRNINDPSDDTKVNNWKKIQSTYIPPHSSSVHQQYMCHLDELDNTAIESIRIGVMCKNKTSLNIALKFELDGKDYAFMSTTLKPKEDRLIRRLIHKTTKASQTIQVKRNQVVENSSSIMSEKALIEKLGTIKVKVFRIQVGTEQTTSSSVASEQTMVKTPDIKIKEGMTKMKDLSVAFGTTNNAQAFQQTGFAYKEEIKTVEYVYHTRLGYLFELRKAGIDISNK